MTMIRAQRHVLMGPNDGNGGGGGGGAGGGKGAGGGAGGEGAGGEGGGEGGEGEVPEGIKKFVTSAIEGAFKPLQQRIVKQIPTMESIRGSITESITAALKDFRPGGGEGAGGGAGGEGGAGGGQGGSNGQGAGSGQPNELAIQVKKLQDQLDAQTKAMRKKEEESEREKQERLRTEERGALTTALLKAGVPETRAAAASAMLFYDKKIVRRNDKGEVCFALTKVYGGEPVEEIVGIDAGVAEWVKSAEGKEFLPPAEASGSGNRGGKPRPGAAGTKPTAGEAYDFVARSVMTGSR